MITEHDIRGNHNCLLLSMEGNQTYIKIFDANNNLIRHSQTVGAKKLQQTVTPGKCRIETDGKIESVDFIKQDFEAIMQEEVAAESRLVEEIAPTLIKKDAIQFNAITSVQLDEADGKTGQDTNKGSGVKTGHIQDNAITDEKIRINAISSAKIKEADGTTGQDQNKGHGIKTPHIQDLAITSVKIEPADGTTGQNTERGSGIKNGHIQNGAITAEKLDQDAVVSEKIARADNSTGQDINTGAGIKTGHIQNGAITSEKLAVVDDDEIINGTFGTTSSPDPVMEDNVGAEFSGVDYGKIRIPHILPTTKGMKLSWHYQVELAGREKMYYHFQIKKDSNGIAGYRIQFARLS